MLLVAWLSNCMCWFACERQIQTATSHPCQNLKRAETQCSQADAASKRHCNALLTLPHTRHQIRNVAWQMARTSCEAHELDAKSIICILLLCPSAVSNMIGAWHIHVCLFYISRTIPTRLLLYKQPWRSCTCANMDLEKKFSPTECTHDATRTTYLQTTIGPSGKSYRSSVFYLQF